MTTPIRALSPRDRHNLTVEATTTRDLTRRANIVAMLNSHHGTTPPGPSRVIGVAGDPDHPAICRRVD